MKRNIFMRSIINLFEYILKEDSIKNILSLINIKEIVSNIYIFFNVSMHLIPLSTTYEKHIIKSEKYPSLMKNI